MKLPWISREAFDLALAAERKRADAEHENAQMLRRQLADLTGRYHQLRLSGYAEPAHVPSRKEPDGVQRAITLRAGSDARLRAQMQAQAAKDLAAGKSPADVERDILTGVTFDPSLGLGVSADPVGH